MGATPAIVLIKQHLIDPEICIRCNTCEDTCPIDAITHDDRIRDRVDRRVERVRMN